MLHKDIYRRIASAKMFIDDNYEAGINLDLLSQHSSLSKFHFHRLFTGVYRKTPHQYIIQKRLDEARKLLGEDNSMTLGDICYTIGFESINSFCLLFRRRYGCTPMQFRQSELARLQAITAKPLVFIPHCFVTSYSLDK